MTAPPSPARERLVEALREFASKVEAACAKADGYESVRDTWWEWEMPDMSSVLAAVEEVVAEERRKMRRTDDGRWPDDVIEIIRSQERRDR